MFATLSLNERFKLPKHIKKMNSRFNPNKDIKLMSVGDRWRVAQIALAKGEQPLIATMNGVMLENVTRVRAPTTWHTIQNKIDQTNVHRHAENLEAADFTDDEDEDIDALMDDLAQIASSPALTGLPDTQFASYLNAFDAQNGGSTPSYSNDTPVSSLVEDAFDNNSSSNSSSNNNHNNNNSNHSTDTTLQSSRSHAVLSNLGHPRHAVPSSSTSKSKSKSRPNLKHTSNANAHSTQAPERVHALHSNARSNGVPKKHSLGSSELYQHHQKEKSMTFKFKARNYRHQSPSQNNSRELANNATQNPNETNNHNTGHSGHFTPAQILLPTNEDLSFDENRARQRNSQTLPHSELTQYSQSAQESSSVRPPPPITRHRNDASTQAHRHSSETPDSNSNLNPNSNSNSNSSPMSSPDANATVHSKVHANANAVHAATPMPTDYQISVNSAKLKRTFSRDDATVRAINQRRILDRRRRKKKKATVHSLWFKSQKQLKQGKQPSILAKYSLKLRNIRHHTAKFQAMQRRISHTEKTMNYLEVMNNLTQSRTRIAVDDDEDASDAGGSASASTSSSSSPIAEAVPEQEQQLERQQIVPAAMNGFPTQSRSRSGRFLD